jgi:hypothetical protein
MMMMMNTENSLSYRLHIIYPCSVKETRVVQVYLIIHFIYNPVLLWGFADGYIF